jgi:hypothetical protein
MTPALRKFTITAHVTFSVGWLGAVAAFLVLSVAGLTSHDADVVRGAYLSMDLISRFVIIPLCFAALATGLLQALRHPMGLVSVLLDTAEIRAGHFCHHRIADTSICGDGCRGEARIRSGGSNIVQRRLRAAEDGTRTRS